MIDPGAPAGDVRRQALSAIAEARPSCLVVDTFPRGIGGELAAALETIEARKVLVQRDLNPRYVEAAGLEAFVASHYDLVLDCEAEPWLVRSADQLPDRETVERILRLDRGASCALVCASGKQDELEWYGAVAAALQERTLVRVVAAERPAGCAEGSWVRYWPAIDLMRCAAVVVGGAGYNTIQECLAWDVPLVARPWPRKYDRQEVRAESAAARGRVTIVRTAEQAARSALELMQYGAPRLPRFTNGAAEAVRLIARGLL
jgi:predicted glycosyltransferase